jgi:hypothetical protein
MDLLSIIKKPALIKKLLIKLVSLNKKIYIISQVKKKIIVWKQKEMSKSVSRNNKIKIYNRIPLLT